MTWTLLLAAAVSIAMAKPNASTTKLKKEDFHRFSWVLENDNKVAVNPADILPATATTYGRDLHWVADPKNRDVILGLKAQGKKFICYFTAGTIPSEKFLSDPQGVPLPTIYDRHFYKDPAQRIPYSEACTKPTPWGDYFVSWKGKTNRAAAVQAITGMMQDPASELCDGFEYDNTDLYGQGEEGKPCASKADVIFVMSNVCKASHKLGKFAVLKNSALVVKDLAQICDGSIVESCVPNASNPDMECGWYKPFAQLKKPVYVQEYAVLDVTGTAAIGYEQKFPRTCTSAKDNNCTRDFAVDCRDLKKLGISEFAVAPSQILDGRSVYGFCSDN